MLSNLSMRGKGIVIVTLPVMLSLVFLAGLIFALQEAETDVERELFSARLSALVSNMQLQYYQAILNARQWHSSRSEVAKEKLDQAIVKIRAQERELVGVVKNHGELEKLAQLVLDDGITAQQFLLKIRNGASSHFGGDLDPRIFHKTSLGFMEALTEDFARLNNSADDLLLTRKSGDLRSVIVTVMIFGASANIVLAVVLALWYSTSVTDRIAIVRANSVRLACGEALAKPLEGGDEIAQLDTSFHRMANAIAEATKKEQALLNNATDVLCSIDKEMRFVTLSAAVEKVWGYSAEELTGARLAQVLSPGTADDTMKNLERCPSMPGQSTAFDGGIKTRDGRVIDASFSCFLSTSEQTFFCVVRDVTKQREFERIKQQLMDTIAHDLRAPIASIKALLDTLTMGVLGELNEKGTQRVAKAEQSADRLLRLVNDLLDYEKFESGQFSLNLQPHSVQDILHSSALSLESLAEEKKLSVKIDGDDLAVLADSDRLTQAIVNILGNAIKFSPEEETVNVRCRSENGSAMIEIADRGPGIPDQQKNEVFERFKQVESTSRTHKGSGLGLPIARQIIDAHGGKLGVTDNEGGGTIFWLTIPLSAS